MPVNSSDRIHTTSCSVSNDHNFVFPQFSALLHKEFGNGKPQISIPLSRTSATRRIAIPTPYGPKTSRTLPSSSPAKTNPLSCSWKISTTRPTEVQYKPYNTTTSESWNITAHTGSDLNPADPSASRGKNLQSSASLTTFTLSTCSGTRDSFADSFQEF